MGQTESASCPAELNLSARTSKKSSRSSGSSSMTVKSEELLTVHQRTLLQKSWRKSQKTGLENIGAQIFLKIYQHEPSVGLLFRLHNVPYEELKYNKKFQSHAMTFTRSIDFMLNNLNQFDVVANFCRQLGRRHVKYISRGFRPEYWDIFAEALTECAIDWEGGLRCREALNGWRTLVSFIIEEMRVGFREAKREQQDRRAMQYNAIVASQPKLVYTKSVTSIPLMYTEDLRNMKEAKVPYRIRKISPSYTSTLASLRDPASSSYSKFKRLTIEREAFSEGANCTREDCCD